MENYFEYAFDRGIQKVAHGDIKKLRKELMSDLRISRMTLYRKQMGLIEPKVTEVATIERIFGKYGITDIWCMPKNINNHGETNKEGDGDSGSDGVLRTRVGHRGESLHIGTDGANTPEAYIREIGDSDSNGTCEMVDVPALPREPGSNSEVSEGIGDCMPTDYCASGVDSNGECIQGGENWNSENSESKKKLSHVHY